MVALPILSLNPSPADQYLNNTTDCIPTVWQIAQRDYKFGKGKHKSLTKSIYDEVGDHFRKLWGKEAGWAHSVLFTADLKAFSGRLAPRIGAEERIKREVDRKIMEELDGDDGMPIQPAERTAVKREAPSDLEEKKQSKVAIGEADSGSTAKRRRGPRR